MNRYLLQSEDKAATNRSRYFTELGLYDFWVLSLKIIGTKYPPIIEITNINDAFELLKLFIAECGNSINIDFPDGCNTNSVEGIEVDGETMRLIWYTADAASKNIEEEDTLNKEIIEINKSVYGENLEQQYGFTFYKLIITPAYILIFAEETNIPEEIENDNEVIKIDRIHGDLKIYEHIWGDYRHEPIVQFRTRYYCNRGVVAVMFPKGATRAFKAEDFFI